MAHTAIWYHTKLPDKIIQEILEEVRTVDDSLFDDSKINQRGGGTLDSKIRKSKKFRKTNCNRI